MMLNKVKAAFRSILPFSLWQFLSKIKRLPQMRLVEGPLTYNQDGLATKHNCDFVRDLSFRRAYDLGKSTGSWGDADPLWRAYVVCWAAHKAMALEGDFVECGVNKGGYSYAIMHYVDFNKSDKNFYLLDTFSGLVDDFITDEERLLGRVAEIHNDCYEYVKNMFSRFPNAVIIKGAVPGTLAEVKAEKVCYLSLDMLCTAPEIAAAEFFWEKMVSGAVILLDDYGFPGHEPQKRAFDDFASTRGVKVLSLPTGQGLIFKP